MDTVTYPETRVAEFIEHHFLPVRLKVKQEPELVKDYLVSWTPNAVIADADGKVHYRIEGYLAPDDFLAELSLGIGKHWLNQKQFAEAKGRFEEVAQRHPNTSAAAQALYWLGVASYKEAHDLAQLRSHWQRLAKEYPHSEWTRRTQIPRKS
jgi:hypothetical protein